MEAEKSKAILGRELSAGVMRVLREVGYATAPELRLLIVVGRCTQYSPRLPAAAPLFSINALPDRVTPRWPSLLLSLGSDIKPSPFTVVRRTADGEACSQTVVIRLSDGENQAQQHNRAMKTARQNVPQCPRLLPLLHSPWPDR